MKRLFDRITHNPIIYAFITILASWFIILAINAVFNWIWVLNHEPDIGQTVLDYYEHCFVMSSILVSMQFPALLIVSIVAAVIRRRYSVVLGISSAILMYILSCVAPIVKILPDPHFILYIVGFPLLASSLQWFPVRVKGSEPATPPKP